jgi:pimeloyl-ACP methyl ester carboxylesterase
MPIVKVGDINMYYEIHGKGEPLVIIPGMTLSVDSFFRHIPVFSREYQVVGFDPRGAGRSDAPDIPYTIKMMADDLAGLLNAISIKSAHIWGVSMGGMIAQEFALYYTGRVRSLILACTGFGQKHSLPPSDPEVIEIFQHPKALPPEEMAMQTSRVCMSREFIDKNPELIAQSIKRAIEHPISPQGYMRQMQTGMSFDTYDRLPDIKAPTLVIHGNADRLLPAENARIMASRIPGAELALLEKMGHGFMTEAFDESNRIMLDFLRRHRSPS